MGEGLGEGCPATANINKKSFNLDLPPKCDAAQAIHSSRPPASPPPELPRIQPKSLHSPTTIAPFSRQSPPPDNNLPFHPLLSSLHSSPTTIHSYDRDKKIVTTQALLKVVPQSPPPTRTKSPHPASPVIRAAPSSPPPIPQHTPPPQIDSQEVHSLIATDMH